MASPYHFGKIVRLDTNWTQLSVFLLFKEIDSFFISIYQLESFCYLYFDWKNNNH